ncbi:MAG: hypothetical protein WBE26_08595, partial [Phycisphaerae bacterium]
PVLGKLWAQIVRWTMRQETPANFDTYTRIDGDRGRIVIDALDKDASYLNLLQLRAKVMGPNSQAIPLRFTQTGPGHYEADLQIEQAGQYLANVQIFDAEGESLGTIRTGFSMPFSPEYRDLQPNEALLRQMAEITGGRWLEVVGPTFQSVEPEEVDVFSHDLPPTEAKRPAWTWVLAWLLLPAFLLDVAVRRLASWLALSIVVELLVLVVLLFGMDLRYGSWWGVLGAFVLAELIGWTIRFRYIGPLFEFMTHTVTALGQTGDRSEAALEHLKSTHEKVRDGLTAAKDEETEPPPKEGPIPLSRETARRRFDVGDEEAARPAGDLDEELGGAEATKPKPQTSRPPAEAGEGDESEEQATTSRLLRAKRRKKRDRREEE